MHMRATHIAHPGIFAAHWRNRVVAMLVALLVAAAALSIVLIATDGDSSTSANPSVQSAPSSGPNEAARGRAVAGEDPFPAPTTGGPNEAARGSAAAGQ
jgi:hypothetical protein